MRIILIVYTLLGLCIIYPVVIVLYITGYTGLLFINLWKVSHHIVDWYKGGMDRIIDNLRE